MIDTADMTVYFVVFSALNLAISLSQFYKVQTLKGFYQVIPFALILVIRISIWKSRESCVKWMGYLFVVALAIQLTHIVFSTPVEFADTTTETLELQ